MKIITHLLLWTLIFNLLIPSELLAESMSDSNSTISPKHIPGAGEFVHGQGYNKILMRILIFGSVPVQGIHYVPDGTDLVFGLVYAGGYGEFTSLDSITIRRRGVPDLFEIDLENLLEEGKPIPKLVDGDVINVPFNWRRDMNTVLNITSFVTAITSFALAMVALTKK